MPSVNSNLNKIIGFGRKMPAKEDVEDFISDGNKAFYSGDYEKAVRQYSKALKHSNSPIDEFECLKRTGLTYKKTENYEKAAKNLGRAVSTINKHPDELGDIEHQRQKGKVLRDLGTCRSCLGKDELAERTFMESLRTFKGVANQTGKESDVDNIGTTLAFRLGGHYRGSGKNQKAKEAMGTANLINSHFKKHGIEKLDEDLAKNLDI